MIIDLTSNCVSIYDNYVNEYKVKSSNLLTEINRINVESICEGQVKYNYLIIPISIYNMIEQSEYFLVHKYETSVENENLKRIGFFGEFECFLDIYLPPDTIIVSWDKSTSRDIKLSNIFSEVDKQCVKEKKIKILS